jgi:ribosome modulation factor
MKKHKRDVSNRHFDRGYMAGNQGKSRDDCPHSQQNHREQWLAGWRDGRTDYWDGVTGSATLPRMHSI